MGGTVSNKFHGVVKSDSQEVSIPVLLRSVTSNQGVTGILAASVNAHYWRQGGELVSIAASDLASLDAGHTDGGWYQVDNVNAPGLYRFDVPDAACQDGVDWVCVTIIVSGTYGAYDRIPLELHGAQESYAELTSTSYGLAQLVRSATPANELVVDAAGNAAADLNLWKGSAPADLSSTLVQAVTALNAQGITDVQAAVAAELDEAIAELSTGAPSVTPTVRTALMALYMAWRNKVTSDGSWLTFHTSAGTQTHKSRTSETSGMVTRDTLQAP
jgi:hypothetical protein